MNITEKLRSAIRDVPDFPKPGILFKDITPILENPQLCREITIALAGPYSADVPDAIVGVESRGFLFGMLLAQHFGIPFIPVRKAGKLPYQTISYSYNLEYGSATVEMHVDSIKPNWKVVVHDDLLATGGTAAAAAELILRQGAAVSGFSFLVELGFLNGNEALSKYNARVDSLISF
ncbi:MAG: adenine phosphoribosyltransferase [Bacteroidetes bacterium]|nr:adenine phosphoribosyltransferase [Bacteroidota bacterium]